MEKYIVTKDEIKAFEGLRKSHFLNPRAKRVNKSLGDLTGLKSLGFHIIEVQPGDETTEFHKHYNEEECVYILEGQAEARLGNQKHRVTAGDFIGYRADGEAHTLANVGECVLICIVVGLRLAHDVADYPDLEKRLYRNQGHPWNLVDIKNIEEPKAGRKV